MILIPSTSHNCDQKTLTLPKVKFDEFEKFCDFLQNQQSSETLTYTVVAPIVNPRTFDVIPTGGVQVWCDDENILTLLSLKWG